MTIKGKTIAIWSVVASMLFLSSALPSAYGLEFPMTSTVEIQGDATALASAANPIDSAAALYGSISLASTSEPEYDHFSQDALPGSKTFLIPSFYSIILV